MEQLVTAVVVIALNAADLKVPAKRLALQLGFQQLLPTGDCDLILVVELEFCGHK